MLKLSKQYGANFHGCEKEALALFMKIDSCRQAKRQAAEPLIMATPKKKGTQELKGLMFDMKFKSTGGRNRGKEVSMVDQ